MTSGLYKCIHTHTHLYSRTLCTHTLESVLYKCTYTHSMHTHTQRKRDGGSFQHLTFCGLRSIIHPEETTDNQGRHTLLSGDTISLPNCLLKKNITRSQESIKVFGTVKKSSVFLSNRTKLCVTRISRGFQSVIHQPVMNIHFSDHS